MSSQSSRGKSRPIPAIVSVSLRVNGDLASEGDIQVDGVVDGNITGAELVIGDTALVRGNLFAECIIVYGTIVGDVSARVVTLKPSASVIGDIASEALGVEGGASFEGGITRLPPGGHVSPLAADDGPETEPAATGPGPMPGMPLPTSR